MLSLPNGNPAGSYGYHQWDQMGVGDAIIVTGRYALVAASYLNRTRRNKRFELCKEQDIMKIVRVQ